MSLRHAFAGFALVAIAAASFAALPGAPAAEANASAAAATAVAPGPRPLPRSDGLTIVFLRHGEKPARGLGQLDCQGFNRALALPDVLLARFGRPEALFAPDPGVEAKDFGQAYNYIRPLATIEPVAIRLGLPVDTRHGLADLRGLEDDLLQPRRPGAVVFVAWEHSLLVQAARDIVRRRGGDPAIVPEWRRDDFDSLYVLELPAAGGASLRVEPQGLNGLSTVCPRAGMGAAAAAASPWPERALIDVGAVEAASRDEAALDARADCLAPASTPWYALDAGSAPVIVTAPHVTRPFRDGAWRFEDGGGTGAVARALHRLTGATALYTVDAAPSDPNFYDDNDFKRTLAGLIEHERPRLLLDIHASHADRPYEVDLGTMNGASLLGRADLVPALIEALRAEGLANISLDYFPAAKQQSDVKFAAAHGVSAIQLEINITRLRPSRGDFEAHRFAQLLQALVRFVERESGGAVPAAGGAAETDLAALACTSRLPAKPPAK